MTTNSAKVSVASKRYRALVGIWDPQSASKEFNTSIIKNIFEDFDLGRKHKIEQLKVKGNKINTFVIDFDKDDLITSQLKFRLNFREVSDRALRDLIDPGTIKSTSIPSVKSVISGGKDKKKSKSSSESSSLASDPMNIDAASPAASRAGSIGGASLKTVISKGKSEKSSKSGGGGSSVASNADSIRSQAPSSAGRSSGGAKSTKSSVGKPKSSGSVASAAETAILHGGPGGQSPRSEAGDPLSLGDAGQFAGSANFGLSHLGGAGDQFGSAPGHLDNLEAMTTLSLGSSESGEEFIARLKQRKAFLAYSPLPKSVKEAQESFDPRDIAQAVFQHVSDYTKGSGNQFAEYDEYKYQLQKDIHWSDAEVSVELTQSSRGDWFNRVKYLSADEPPMLPSEYLAAKNRNESIISDLKMKD